MNIEFSKKITNIGFSDQALIMSRLQTQYELSYHACWLIKTCGNLWEVNTIKLIGDSLGVLEH